MKKEFKTLSEKKEIEEILSGHGLNKSFRRHIISLFERKEKEFIKKLKETIKECYTADYYADGVLESIIKEIDKLAGKELI